MLSESLAPRPSQQDWPPHGLVSLLDMLRFHGDRFVSLFNHIVLVEKCMSTSGKNQEFWTKNRSFMCGQLEDMKKLMIELGLNVSSKQVNKAVSAISAETPHLDFITSILEELRSRIEDEMDGRLFYYVSDASTLIDESFAPFGEAVRERFPSAGYDLTEASFCLAMRRSTACVLHLMRALEVPLRALATATGVSMAKDNWNKALNNIENRIRNKDEDGKRLNDGFWIGREAELDTCTQAATTFFLIKNAWRNYAAHGKDKYTQEEAEAIFQQVKAFCRHLSSALGESGSSQTSA